jgi:hypothetical protein
LLLILATDLVSAVVGVVVPDITLFLLFFIAFWTIYFAIAVIICSSENKAFCKFKAGTLFSLPSKVSYEFSWTTNLTDSP